MAVPTPQELREIQKLLDKIQTAYNKLGATNPYKNFDTSSIKDSQVTIEQLQNGLEGVNYRLEATTTSFKDLSQALNAIVKEINPKAVNNAKAFENGFKAIVNEARKLQYEEEGINKLSQKELESIKERVEKRRSDTKAAAEAVIQEAGLSKNVDRRTKAYKDASEEQKAAINYLRESVNQEDTLIDKINQRIAQEERINDAMGLGGVVIGSVKGALDKLGMGGLAEKLGFDKAADDMRKLAEKMEEGGEDMSSFATKSKILKEGFNSMGGSLMKNLKDPLSASLFVITQLVNALQSVDKLTGEAAKNLGISYKEANNMVSDMTDIANLSGDAHVNTEGLVKSQLELSKALGTNSQISGELLVDFTKLTHQAGYSVEAMTNLTKISQGTGKSLEENTAELLGQAKAFNINNGLALNEKELVEEVANTSAATVLTLGKSSKALVANVAAAKQFGINMQQAENISSSLLNFQSSIENEMEAELLTGKQLNLEQARMLALKGETGKAAAEVLKQVGSTADFQNMNVMAQESLAKAMGMSREELAKSLIEREALAKVGMADLSAQEAYNKLKKQGLSDDEIALQLGNENLANQMKSESAQERIAAITSKLQDLFMGIAEPIMAIVDPLLNLVTAVLPAINFLLQPIKTTFDGISKIITGDFESLSGWEIVLGGIATVLGTIVGLGKIQQALDEGKIKSASEYLAMLGLENIQRDYALARQEGMNVLEATADALKKSQLATTMATGYELIKQSALKVKDFIMDKASLALQLAMNAATLVYNGILAVANAIKLGGLLPLIASMAMTAFSSLAAIPFIGPILGIAGAAAALALGYGYYSKAQSAGDMYSPADGKTQVSTKEGGLFELSKNDDLVAAPGAADALMNDNQGESASPGGGGINLAPLVAQMTQMNATLNAILSKEGTITLDGTKVGTALTVGSSKLQ